ALEDLLARAHRLLERARDRGLVGRHADAGEDYLRHTGPGRIEEHRRATQHAGRLQPTDAPPADRRRSADPLGKLLGRQAGVSLERLDDPDVERIVELRARHRAPPWRS